MTDGSIRNSFELDSGTGRFIHISKVCQHKGSSIANIDSEEKKRQ